MKWPVKKLSEIADRVDYGLTASASRNNDSVKFLRITDIQNGEVKWNSVPGCECSDTDVKKFELKNGDIVFARTGGTTGKSFLILNPPERAVFASYLIRVRLHADVDFRYVRHYFDTPGYWASITECSTGSTQPGVNASKLKSLQIPLPPLAEQKRIASILDKADAIRRKLQQSLRLSDDFLRSVFLDMFGDPVTNPKGWDEGLVLGEVADIVSGVAKGRNLLGKKTREVPYLAVANVQDKRLNLNVVKSIPATSEEIQKYRLVQNDLLLTEGGDPDKLGRGNLWHDELAECIHQNHIFRVRLTHLEIHPVFLNWLVGSERGKKYFLRSAKQTTGIASINMTQLRAFPMLMPPLLLQKRFAALIQAVAKKTMKLTLQARTAEALFSSLQQRAFRGEL
jgi:type I restriction enzyme, S subunit